MRCPKCGSWITGMPLYFPIVQKFSSEPITDPTIHIDAYAKGAQLSLLWVSTCGVDLMLSAEGVEEHIEE